MSRESLHPVLILKNCQPLEEEGLGSFSKAPNKATMHLHFYGLCFSKTRSKWPVALTLKSPRWCMSRDRFGSIKRWKLADEGTYWGAQGEQRNGLLLPPPRRSWLTLDLNMPESSISYKELGGRTQSINSVLAYGSATCPFFSTSSFSMRNPGPLCCLPWEHRPTMAFLLLTSTICESRVTIETTLCSPQTFAQKRNYMFSTRGRKKK